jgi:REP element-mobilizing transposase RayT
LGDWNTNVREADELNSRWQRHRTRKGADATLQGSNPEHPMAQTLVNLMVHVIFSTKNRMPLIAAEIEPELFAYIGGILKNHECRLLDGGGTANHVHLLISQSKNLGLSSILKDVKKDSSSWIKTKGNQFRNFHWQDGYGAFSIGSSQVAKLHRYIANQKEHHRKQSFEDEFVRFLNKYGLEYDEQYLWS